MGNCSIPHIFGLKKWFDKNFGDCCDWHDERYVLRDCWKVKADYGVSVRIATKKVYYLPLGVVSFVILTVHPLAYIMWYTNE